jgi:hypothetical protein
MSYLSEVLNTTPAGVWPLGISSSQALKDYSTNGRNGTLGSGGASSYANDGAAGMKATKAGTYSGGDVIISADASWQKPVNGGAMCWGKHSNTSGIHVLAEKRDRNVYIFWNRDDAATGVNHSFQALLYCGANTIIIDSAMATNDGAWHHYAMSWDWNGSNLTTLRLYIDNVLKATGTTTTAVDYGVGSSSINENLVWGSEWDLTRNWNGDLLWGSFHTSTLTAAQISACYKAGLREGIVY